jgi:hypothetical protein
MRRIGVALIVCVLVAALAPAGGTEDARLALVRVRVESADQATFLLTHFDETHNHHNGFVELLLWPGDEERLKSAGIDYEVVVEDVLRRDLAATTGPSQAVPMPGPDQKDYCRLSTYVSEMRKLARKHPSFVRVISSSTSRSRAGTSSDSRSQRGSVARTAGPLSTSTASITRASGRRPSTQ